MPLRRIRKLLVANRGEIATRIISTARELGLNVYGLYTESDISHISGLTNALKLSSPAAYTDVDELVQIARDHEIDAVHPGYGFLSESAEFARRLAEAGVQVVGPGAEILEQTGDKLKARKLAEECNVPVLPALKAPTDNVATIESFAEKWGYPIIIKAVDGGGGRGIRIAHHKADLSNLTTRALAESPSGQVYAERAAINGYRHVEIQIIGDSEGNVQHLWERECSIQRRFQKVVEFTPSSIQDRSVIKKVIEAAVRMAKKVHYTSLGTFEFLVRESPPEIYFLEINPRLQVEHTITEMLCFGVDLVKMQLLIADRSQSLKTLLKNVPNHPSILVPPAQQSLQLRITAEDVAHNWSLSVGKINQFYFPTGNGIRVDTHLQPPSTIITTDFDSLLAKLIITASSWPAVVSKAKRALEDIRIEGIKTNLTALRGIISHPDFEAQQCDTQWLERCIQNVVKRGDEITNLPIRRPQSILPKASQQGGARIGGGPMIHPTDKFHISLSQQGPDESSTKAAESHLSIDRIQKNNFPDSLSAHVTYTNASGQPTPYFLEVNRTSASAGSITSAAKHKKGDRANPNHVIAHIPGKLVELLVDEGDLIEKGQVCAVMSQMKMELEIRASKAGRVVWTFEGEEGEELGEGILIVEIVEVKDSLSKL